MRSRASALFLGILLICAHPAHAAGATRRPNILLIVLDTVRFDATSFGDAARNNTPFLASLASRSVVFTRAYSTHDFTPTSHFSMFTGLRDGLATNDDRPENGVPWQLARTGYSTFAVISNNLLLASQMPVMRGFARMDELLEKRVSPITYLDEITEIDARLKMFRCAPTEHTRAALYFSADRLLSKATADIHSATPPYFGFINVMDAHEPYIPDPAHYAPEKELPRGFNGDILARAVPDYLAHPEHIPDQARRRRIEEQLRLVKFPHLLADDIPAEALAIYRRRYLARVHELDGTLRLFFETLRKQHMLDNTIVIITADHGESFGEEGYVTHMLGDHGDYEATHHVPLIVVLPRNMKRNSAVVDRVVSIANLAPTIYELAGVDFRPFRKNHSNYPPSLATILTYPPAPTAVALPPAASAQDLSDESSERSRMLRSLGYIH